MSAPLFTVAPTAANPRLAAALALAALAVNPDLPPANWSVASSGHLSGTVRSKAAFEAYLAVVGAESLFPTESSDMLFTTFMGVEVSLSGLYALVDAAVAS